MIYNWVIYKITSPSGRTYIGKTSRLKKRMADYNCLSATINQKIIHRSIKKYGWESHKFEIIDYFKSNLEYSNGKEMFWIRTYMSNCIKYPNMNGMNLTDGGGGCKGYIRSEKSKKEQSIRIKSNPKEMSRLASGSMHRGFPGAYKGKKRPSWVGEKISKGKLGKLFSENHKTALSKAKIGKPSNNRRAIIQYDINGNYIKEHPSIASAKKYINGFTSAICNVLNGTYKQHKGFVFKYKDAA